MSKFWKKFCTIVCVVASVLIIGNSVSGWFGEDKTNDTDNKTETSDTVEE